MVCYTQRDRLWQQARISEQHWQGRAKAEKLGAKALSGDGEIEKCLNLSKSKCLKVLDSWTHLIMLSRSKDKVLVHDSL